MKKKRCTILQLPKKIYLTNEAYNILRKEKSKQGLSMARITCNLILEKYGQHQRIAPEISNEENSNL